MRGSDRPSNGREAFYEQGAEMVEGGMISVRSENRGFAAFRGEQAKGTFFPQQPERLGVLPIKLRGGLGQPPETLHQVPRGSEGMEPVPK